MEKVLILSEKSLHFVAGDEYDAQVRQIWSNIVGVSQSSCLFSINVALAEWKPEINPNRKFSHQFQLVLNSQTPSKNVIVT